jgi:RNA polymerase sigma factor (sigma-70 family)
MESDQDLVERANAGSADAYAALFARHWPTTWKAAFAVTGRRELADDAAQDAFIRAATELTQFDPRRPFGPWIARIAVNRAVDSWRRDRRLRPFAEAEMDSLDASEEGIGDLQGAVRALPAERRLIVVLHFFLGFSIEETATIAGVPTGTAASRLSRSLSALRETLKDAHYA